MLANDFPNLISLLFGVHLVESNGVFPGLCIRVNLVNLEIDSNPQLSQLCYDLALLLFDVSWQRQQTHLVSGMRTNIKTGQEFRILSLH